MHALPTTTTPSQPLTAEREYIVISYKRSTNVLLFWRADARGYTPNPLEAGRYKESTIMAALDYYNNGPNCAVPIDQLSVLFPDEFTVPLNARMKQLLQLMAGYGSTV